MPLTIDKEPTTLFAIKKMVEKSQTFHRTGKSVITDIPMLLKIASALIKEVEELEKKNEILLKDGEAWKNRMLETKTAAEFCQEELQSLKLHHKLAHHSKSGRTDV